MNSSQFDREMWIIGRMKHLDVSAIWSQFHYASIPDGTLVSFRSPNINRTSIKASKIEDILDGAYVPSFEVLGESFSFDYGQNFDCVFIQAASTVLIPKVCDEIVSETVADDPNFVQAHFVDKNYQYLQNIYDPIQFRGLGLSMHGLPMKSNGLPFPLEQQIVDTSQNPGRFRLCQGYVEASAAYMWFGDLFWQITGADPILAASRMPEGVTMLFDKCWKLYSSTGLFSDENTAGIQNGIREAIFRQLSTNDQNYGLPVSHTRRG